MILHIIFDDSSAIYSNIYRENKITYGGYVEIMVTTEVYIVPVSFYFTTDGKSLSHRLLHLVEL
jgi:hypothetical protein